MKIGKLSGALVAVLAMGLTFAGCAPSGPSASSSPAASVAPGSTASTGGTYTFTDGVGRQVVLPKDIERVAPSGPLAQLVLFALCPDKLVGLASMFDDSQFQYIDPKYKSLPVLGNFYGNTLNLETVMKANPQVIIDIGDVKQTAVSDLDGIQQKTGIPTIFVNMASLDSIASAYQTLGAVTGDTAQADKLAHYATTTLATVRQKVASIPASARPTVYYGQDNGLTAAVAGTTHSAVIDTVGATNVAKISQAAGSGTASVSMEQLLAWQPDVVLFAPGTVYGSVATSATWQGLTAIKTGKYYEIPNGPYNWIDQPPSVNQLLGIVWLANLLYPTVFHDDMVSQTQEFYQLFYHCTVTSAQVQALLAHSTDKK